MNTGLGLGAGAQGLGSALPMAFPASTPFATAATPSAGANAATPSAGANAELLKGRFAALLAAIEMGSEAGSEMGSEISGHEIDVESGSEIGNKVSNPVRADDTRTTEPSQGQSEATRRMPLETTPYRSIESADLARLRDWIAEMVATDTTATPAVDVDLDALIHTLPELATPNVIAASVALAMGNEPATMRSMARPSTSPSAATAVRNVEVAVRDLDALHPELKIRVERVVTRMQQEFGHRVEVVETIRSQARQDALYAQGRSTPGERVTWTRESLHQHGHAADLQVDGSWSNREAYARLQKIAQEEGLATLGARDAGHVELRSAELDGVRAAKPAPATSVVAPIAPIAAVAPVARVAQVARVAGTAQVASSVTAQHGTPAKASQPTDTVSVAPRQVEAPSTAAAPTPTAAPSVADAPRKSESPRPTNHAAVIPERPEPLERNTVESAGAAVITDAASIAPAPSGTAMPAVGTSPDAMPTFEVRTTADTAAPSNQGERIEHIDAIDDARREQPLQSITLRVEDADGQDHRIRVDLRGGEVHADITAASGAQARAISDALPELRQRLGAQGLDATAVNVRTWLSDQPSSGERSTPQRESQQQRQEQQQQQSHRDPRQSHQSPRPWYDVEGEMS